MTTKDYVYLGLLVLAALVFYCHGFYAGVSRSARVFDNLLDDDGETVDSTVITSDEEEVEPVPHTPRHSFSMLQRRESSGGFANN